MCEIFNLPHKVPAYKNAIANGIALDYNKWDRYQFPEVSINKLKLIDHVGNN